jgi:hypothetical protein
MDMPIWKHLLTTIWYALLLFETIVWICTITGVGWSGLISFIAFVTIIPLLLAVEGLELSVASLLSSKANLSARAARELDLIKADPTLPFFPNRQFFVVASIVLLTMASAFDQIYVPGLGWTSSYATLFNMAFPTHTVLLLSQVPGKMLALYAPSRFLNQTWWTCMAVRFVGELQVTTPANFFTKSLAKLLGYPVRHAPPPTDVRFVYPVFDYIDNQWVYVLNDADVAYPVPEEMDFAHISAPGPAHEAVVDRRTGTIGFGTIAPTAAAPEHTAR